MSQALGMVETKGLVALFEAVEAMLKKGDVTFVGWQTVGWGLVTAFIEGDPQAVRAAAEAGAEAGSRIGQVIAVQMIAEPHGDLPKFAGRGSRVQVGNRE